MKFLIKITFIVCTLFILTACKSSGSGSSSEASSTFQILQQTKMTLAERQLISSTEMMKMTLQTVKTIVGILVTIAAVTTTETAFTDSGL